MDTVEEQSNVVDAEESRVSGVRSRNPVVRLRSIRGSEDLARILPDRRCPGGGCSQFMLRLPTLSRLSGPTFGLNEIFAIPCLADGVPGAIHTRTVRNEGHTRP